MPQRRTAPPFAAEALAAARSIAGDLAAADHADASLRGSSAVWLLVAELGEDAPEVRVGAVQRWEDAAVAALSQLDASFFEGMLGAAWMLALHGRPEAAAELGSVDEAVLDLLSAPWDGGLSAFGGGLAGFGAYGLARARARGGRMIVRRCAALFGELARRDGREVAWAPGAASLPAALRDRAPPLFNREGSAAAVGFLAAAARTAPPALVLARRGARALARRLESAARDAVGVATAHAAPGLLHGSGTWALGSAGAVAALLSVGRASRELEDAARCGRMLADLDPELCAVSDASLGTGTAGIACVLQALAEEAREPVIARAADHWHLRTLRCRRIGEGFGGYLHRDALASVATGGGRWQPRAGLLEGAAGTALSLLCAARGARVSPWLVRCLLG